jgi:hypothetical protein
MTSRPYLMISGSIFGLVGLAHLVRIIERWAFTLGPFQVPTWMSAIAAVGGFSLGLWGWVQAGKSAEQG